MLKPSLFSLLSTALLGLVFSFSAVADTVSLGVAPAGYATTTFDSGTLPAGWTATGNAGIASASVGGQYTQPSGDTTPFAYVGPGGIITANFATGVTALDLLWGSPDTWNSITFTGTGGSVSYTPGSGLLSVLNPVNSGSQYVLFTASPGTTWTSVSFSSTLPAFEFDTVATLPALVSSPEPAGVALLACGLVVLMLAVRQRF